MAKISGMCKHDMDERKASRIFIDWVKSLNNEMNIPTKVKELVEEDISTLAKIAEKEANPLYPVPILLSAKELEDMYKKLLVK